MPVADNQSPPEFYRHRSRYPPEWNQDKTQPDQNIRKQQFRGQYQKKKGRNEEERREESVGERKDVVGEFYLKGYKVARHGQDRNQADTTMPTVTSAILVEGLRVYRI